MRRSRERRMAMLEAIASGANDIKLLAEKFGVSFSTVRRDLQRLSKEKAVARTYGGAMLAPCIQEENYPVREWQHRAAKQAIAQAAAAQVGDGETIILDGGSTITSMARFLYDKELTVITNNIKLTAILADAPNIKTIFLGGSIRPISMSAYGPFAEDALRCLTADRAFTSGNGLVAERGLCEATMEQISLKLLMMRQAKETFVLVDASKLGGASQPVWAQLPLAWTLVTDADENLCQPFVQVGARLLCVNASGADDDARDE